MGLGFNVMDYRKEKKVKFTDSYIVEILDKENGKVRKFSINGTETKEVLDNSSSEVESIFHNAITVRIPNIKTTSEQLKYNVFGHNFLRLDLDSVPDTLDLTIYETSDNKTKSFVNYMMERTGFNESYYGKYRPFDKVSEINVFVLNNDLTKKVFEYHFKGLKLVNYDYGYSYDYKSSELPTMNLSFAFEHFSFITCDETIVYRSEDKTNPIRTNMKNVEDKDIA